MKVVVANPPWPGEGYGARSNTRWPHRRGDKRLAFPIYLAYAAAVLKKSGFKARGVDAVYEELGIPDFVERMKKIEPDVIMMEVSTPSIEYDLKTAGALKGELPKTFIVFCGPHATHFHKQIIGDCKSVDACIRKEFEYAIRDICFALKGKKSLKGVKGITFRNRGGKTIVNKERELIRNLDELPLPDREDFRIEDYQQAFYSGKKTALMISSRGCPFRCTYCLWPNALFSHNYRMRSPKNVVEEMERLIKNHGIDEVFFDDDEFIINKGKVQEICREIVRRGIRIKWFCMGRVDVVDEKTLEMMKGAGCWQIFYGFESGSDKILKSSKKNITKEQMKRAVRMTRKAGMVAAGSFIIGLPEESRETLKETLEFAKELKADWVQFCLAAPFPGTEFYEEVKRKRLLNIESWSDLDGTKGPIVNTLYLFRGNFRGIIRRAYISYYLSPGIVWQNLKGLRNINNMRRVLRGIKSVFSRIFYYKE